MFRNNKDIKYGYETSKFLKLKKNHYITKEETLKNFLIVGREAQKAQRSFIEKYLEVKSGFILFDFSEDDSYLDNIKKIISVYAREDDLVEFKGIDDEKLFDINEIIIKNKILIIKSNNHEIEKIFLIFESMNNKKELGYPVFLNEWNIDFYKSEQLKDGVSLLNSKNVSLYLTKDNFFHYGDGLKGYYDTLEWSLSSGETDDHNIKSDNKKTFLNKAEIWSNILGYSFKNIVITKISKDETIFMLSVWGMIYESFYAPKEEDKEKIKFHKMKRINMRDFYNLPNDNFRVFKSHEIFFPRYRFHEPKK